MCIRDSQGSGCATAGSALEAAGSRWKLPETAGSGSCPLSLALCGRPGRGTARSEEILGSEELQTSPGHPTGVSFSAPSPAR
eukprot:8326367-Alexandrium_andersonii.AAC.1